jgi:hypothetical protein
LGGGKWGYQSHQICEMATAIQDNKHILVELLNAVAQTEHIIDWAESGETVRHRKDCSGAERDLYEMWLDVFDKLYND